MTRYTVDGVNGVRFPAGTQFKLTQIQHRARSHQVVERDGVHVSTDSLGFKRGEQVETVAPVADKGLLIELGQPAEAASPSTFPSEAQPPSANSAVMTHDPLKKPLGRSIAIPGRR